MKKILSIIVAGLMLFTIAFSFSSIAKASGEKVNICHRTGSESNPWNAKEISTSALETHLGHGDFLYDGPVKGNGKPTKDGDEWCENNVPQPQGIQDLVLSVVCSGPGDITKWKVTNPNNFVIQDVHFHVTPGDEEGTFDAAIGDTFFETSTPGEIKVTIYWDGDGKDPSEFDCADNKNVGVCSTPPPTPTPTISPQVLGTATSQGVGGAALPTTGANDYSLYYLLGLGSLGLAFYLKKSGWAKLS